ncbi:hypothetical protein B1756_15900 [Natrarchaeobaculum aegyptiacum]|uniref:Uncharacterized protein n=1 Tax=Natrarchaeobaculum aegyptiacum TaxID=745377 RepID=A0A2Z2HUX3_9EURY|nr:hypothetical protein B1756_15900 [Natrarchaeobaculum aegyptiacum]
MQHGRSAKTKKLPDRFTPRTVRNRARRNRHSRVPACRPSQQIDRQEREIVVFDVAKYDRASRNDLCGGPTNRVTYHES